MKKDNKGFTLIELIVVVLIIAIIAVAMTPQVTKWVKKSREAMDTTNAGTIKTCFDVALVEDLSAISATQHNHERYYIRYNSTGSKMELLGISGGTWDSTAGNWSVAPKWNLEWDDTSSSPTPSAFVKKVIDNVSGKDFPNPNLCKGFYVIIEDDGVEVIKTSATFSDITAGTTEYGSASGQVDDPAGAEIYADSTN